MADTSRKPERSGAVMIVSRGVLRWVVVVVVTVVVGVVKSGGLNS